MWSQELEWHLLAPLILFGMCYALLHGEHVRVDILYAKFTPRGKALVDLVSALLAVVSPLMRSWLSLRYVQQSYGSTRARRIRAGCRIGGC